jgi:hypothetical protein
MNTIKFIIIVSMVLLSTDLVYHQIVNAQETNETQTTHIPFTYPNGTITGEKFLNHTRHINELLETIRVLTNQCATVFGNQDVSAAKSCINFTESIDKHLTNESANDINPIKLSVMGGFGNKMNIIKYTN